MTETRIKEKLLELLVIYKINLKKTFTIDFARLICEEMTGKMIIPAETFGDQGYNVRVAENEVKAQEILKALE